MSKERYAANNIKLNGKEGDIAFLPQDAAREFVYSIVEHLADWPIKTAAAFRNALLGDGMLAINPILDIQEGPHVQFLRDALRMTVAEGKMIDFGFIPNEVIKTEAGRGKDAFEAGELQHPYENWLAISAWEGGMCGYHVCPHPFNPKEVLVIELYGVTVPGVADAIMIYDVVSLECKPGETRMHPARIIVPETEASLQLRGSNSLDPLVTCLRFLADASIPVINRPAPEKLNKSRAKLGKFPIPDHTQVLTKDYVASFHSVVANGGRVNKGGHHASPVAHWRRAHKRTLACGRVIPVKSTKVNWRTTEELHRLFYRVPEGGR
jgi:hypothetical protein